MNRLRRTSAPLFVRRAAADSHEFVQHADTKAARQREPTATSRPSRFPASSTVSSHTRHPAEGIVKLTKS